MTYVGPSQEGETAPYGVTCPLITLVGMRRKVGHLSPLNLAAVLELKSVVKQLGRELCGG
jgi:hypothetical protein